MVVYALRFSDPRTVSPVSNARRFSGLPVLSRTFVPEPLPVRFHKPTHMCFERGLTGKCALVRSIQTDREAAR